MVHKQLGSDQMYMFSSWFARKHWFSLEESLFSVLLVWYYVISDIEASMQILRSCFSILANLLCPDELLCCTFLYYPNSHSHHLSSPSIECFLVSHIWIGDIIIFELILTFIYFTLVNGWYWGLQVKHLSVQQPPIKITLKALHVTPHKSYVTTDYKITPRATAQNTGR